MRKALRNDVCRANLQLVEYGLVLFTWGNVSAIDRNKGLVVIKPSGVAYNCMSAKDMVITNLDGKVIEGDLNPSSDLPTHLALYRSFPHIGGITHTHSTWATIFAQAGVGIPPLGTTHADTFFGEIPCTRPMTENEILGEYEKETGAVIAERFSDVSPEFVSGVLVHGHGPFTWGATPDEAVHNAKILEEVAMMAWHTMVMNGKDTLPLQPPLLLKHYLRKHGQNAYYGQH